MRYARILATLAAATLPSVAHAHVGLHSDGALAGLSHPISGLDHVLAMVAVGLWAGLVGGRARIAYPVAFVTMMALGPTLLACALGTGLISLHANWATTFYVMLGVWAVRWAPRVDPAKLVRSVLTVGIAVDLLMVAGVSLSNGLLVDLIKRTSRSNFPAIELGVAMDKVWDSRFSSPLRVVIGETWIAGVTSVKSRHQPYVLQYGIPSESPWISPKLIDDCGALIVVDRRETEKPPNDNVSAYLARATQKGTIDIPWNRFRPEPTLTVEWAIIEPRNPGACTR